MFLAVPKKKKQTESNVNNTTHRNELILINILYFKAPDGSKEKEEGKNLI